MKRKAQEIWNDLKDAGLIKSEFSQTSVPDISVQSSPWYVKTLLGFSAWLASLFMLGFVVVGLNLF